MHDYEFCELPPPRDGMIDIPPRKVPRPDGLPTAIEPEHLTRIVADVQRAILGDGGWCAPDDMAELYAEAAAARDAYGAYLWENTPGFVMPPTDEEVMQPIVEAAMRAIGMNVPLRPVIPTIMRGRRPYGR